MMMMMMIQYMDTFMGVIVLTRLDVIFVNGDITWAN